MNFVQFPDVLVQTKLTELILPGTVMVRSTSTALFATSDSS